MGNVQQPGAASIQSTMGAVEPRQENRVLASLPQAELAALSRHLHVVPLPPISVLQHHHGLLDFVYFPHDGLVSLLAVTPTGETVEAASVGRAGAVCPFLISGQRHGFLTAVSHGATGATRMPVTQLLGAQREFDTFGSCLARLPPGAPVADAAEPCCGTLHAVEHRLARWVLEAADRLESDRISIPVTQQHVARRLGVRRTTLLASKLQDAGAIHWRGARVDILDRPRLESPQAASIKNLGA